MLIKRRSLQELHDNVKMATLLEGLVVVHHARVPQLLLHYGHFIEEFPHALLPLKTGLAKRGVGDLDLCVVGVHACVCVCVRRQR